MKNILLVVDMQNGFSRYEQTKILGEKIKQLVNLKLFDCVIATRFINYEGSQYTSMLNWHRLISSPDIDLIEGLNPDITIDKNIYTCVNADFLNIVKEVNDGVLPTHIFVCGADTDCCVLKISTDLFEQNIMPIVLLNYCDSNGGPESHRAGQLVMGRLIGRRTIINEEIATREQLQQIIDERKY